MKNKNTSNAEQPNKKVLKKHNTPDVKPILTAGLIIFIFTAAGYEFQKEKPTGRLLFWHPATEKNVQFWVDAETDMTKVMTLICGRAFESGESFGRNTVRTEIKRSLGLPS